MENDALEKALANPAEVTELNLRYNELTSLPAEIWQMTNLERIYLGDKRLIEIARALVVSGCKISYYGLVNRRSRCKIVFGKSWMRLFRSLLII